MIGFFIERKNINLFKKITIISNCCEDSRFLSLSGVSNAETCMLLVSEP